MRNVKIFLFSLFASPPHLTSMDIIPLYSNVEVFSVDEFLHSAAYRPANEAHPAVCRHRAPNSQALHSMHRSFTIVSISQLHGMCRHVHLETGVIRLVIIANTITPTHARSLERNMRGQPLKRMNSEQQVCAATQFARLGKHHRPSKSAPPEPACKPLVSRYSIWGRPPLPDPAVATHTCAARSPRCTSAPYSSLRPVSWLVGRRNAGSSGCVRKSVAV
jgi:hypothetical protein